MTIIPRPWAQVVPGTQIIDGTGRQREATVADYPSDLATPALVCVFSDAELDAQAIFELVMAFGARLLD